MSAIASDFRSLISDRIAAAHQSLASRWLDELKQLVPVAPDQIFPGGEPLGDTPALIRELAAFLRTALDEPFAANAVVTAKATELGQLRHAQRASVHQVLREYRALRVVISQFIREETIRLRLTPGVEELFELTNRLDAAIEALLQTTVNTFVAQYTETITQHTAQLEAFSRMVTHELRQPLGTLQFGVKLLGTEETWGDPAKRDRVLSSAERSVTRMKETLDKLVTLAWAAESPDTALVQHVELSTMVDDVASQLREMAEARDVQVLVTSPLPAVTVDRARLELVLVNLVSNAIKYSDPAKPTRTVEIAAVPSTRPDVCTIRVSDNGIGIADPEMQPIFARFYRGHAGRDRELGASGMGLGLSIVADCVEALKGSIRVESTPGEGTTFFLELPSAPTS
jgi:signal transduction histidine kinase